MLINIPGKSYHITDIHPRQSLKHNLTDCLRKQARLSNRINLLLLEKDRKLKTIEKRIIMTQQDQEIRIEKAMQHQEVHSQLVSSNDLCSKASAKKYTTIRSSGNLGMN
jgi:hypothetical protein